MCKKKYKKAKFLKDDAKMEDILIGSKQLYKTT